VPNATDNGSNLNECFTVGPVTPTLTTQASGPIQLGGTIHDTATLSGTASQPGSPIIGGGAGAAAGGTISFTVFGPNNCTTVAGSSSASVSGDGSYGSGDFTPGAVGTYTFVASYSGSSPNTNGVGPTACPDATGTETVLVNATTQIGTTQNWLPNDSATVSSPQNAPFTGTITFTLYNGAGCTGSVLYSEPTAQTVSNGSPTAVTHNSTFTVSASTTVYWGVVFTSNTPNVGSSSSCVEQTSLTITGNS